MAKAKRAAKAAKVSEVSSDIDNLTPEQVYALAKEKGIPSPVLSDRQREYSEDIPAGPARQAWIDKQLLKKLRQALKNDNYLTKRNELSFVETKLGMIAVNGTGTKRNAIFTKQQGLEFCERVAEFKQMLLSLPDTPYRRR